MKKRFLIIAMAFIIVQLHSQTQDIGKLVIEANDFDKRGDILHSIETKKELIKLLPGEIIEISLAKSFALINELDSSFVYLLNNTVNSSDLKLLTKPEFYLLISDPRWSMIETQILDNYIKRKDSSINVDFTRELLRLRLIDQSLFYRIELAEEKGDILMSSYLWNEKRKTKKESYKKLKLLISEYGYPTEDLVTEEGTEAAFLIIQHLENLSEQTSYLSIIKEYAEKGLISKHHYAYLVDRIKARNNLPQIYGTQSINDVIYKVESIEKINELRKSVGLPEFTDEQLANYTLHNK